MTLFRNRSALCRAAVLIAGLLCATGTSAGESPKIIRIIYTNDTLGWLKPCG